MSVLIAKIVSGISNAQLGLTFEGTQDKHSTANRLSDFITGLQSGSVSAQDSSNPPQIQLSIRGNAVQATGTITFSGVASNNDTVLINGVTFTFKTSGATGNQANIGATATDSATNLAAAINASVTALIPGYVTASNLAGVLTITSAEYGIAGNQATIAKGTDAGSVMSVSGARLTGGLADASAKTISF